LVVVLGHEAAAIQSAVDLSDATIVVNAQYAVGLSTSLQAGIAVLAPEIEAAILVTGDQPLIDPDLLRRLQAAHTATGQPLVATHYDDHSGVPLLLARPAWPLVQEVHGDQGARALLRLHPDQVALVPASHPAMALDVDT